MPSALNVYLNGECTVAAVTDAIADEGTVKIDKANNTKTAGVATAAPLPLHV
jgi:hypothetical protein